MIIKLKNETFTSKRFQKLKKILECMMSYPEGVTPKFLSEKTGINVNTIKSILPSVSGIKKTFRGFYIVESRGDTPPSISTGDLTDWNFHNCILSVNLKNYKSLEIPIKIDLDLLILELTISNSGNAVCRVSTDYPLNISSICLVYGYFIEYLKGYSNDNIAMCDITIRTIEFNKDYANLRLDGINSISLDNFISQFKIYQKKLAVRVEHKTKLPIQATTIIDMLKNNNNSQDLDIENRLNTQLRVIERLLYSTSNNTQLLYKIVDKVNKLNEKG